MMMKTLHPDWLRATLADLHALDDTLIIAVSGGIDSMVLLDVLRRLGQPMTVAHMNFHLREDAHVHQELVTRYCTEHDLPLVIKEVTPPAQGNIENWARDTRYQWFEELRQEHEAQWIVTAHHQDDQIETILLHLMRGAGLQGLQGMAPTSGQLLRPLLTLPKAALLEYAEAEHVSYYEDHTNTDPHLRRNFVRHQILPLWRAIDPEIESHILNLGTHSKEAEAWVTKELEQSPLAQEWQHHGQVAVDVFVNTPPLLQQAFLRNLYAEAQGSTQDLYRAHLEEIQRWICTGRSGTQKTLAPRCTLSIEHGVLAYAEPRSVTQPMILTPGQTIHWGSWEISCIQRSTGTPTADTLLLASAVPLTFTVRSWEQGDSFQPLGLQGRKKLSDYFIDAKVPLSQRSNIPIVLATDAQIAGVYTRPDEAFKLRPELPYIYELHFYAHSD